MQNSKTRQVRVDSKIHQKIKILAAKTNETIKSLFERIANGESAKEIAQSISSKEKVKTAVKNGKEQL